MPRKDTFHDVVALALQKENWTITDDPLFISTKNNINFFIDLGLEMVIGAEKEGKHIAVEIKSFDDESSFYTFYEILGQYLIYQLALEEQKRPFELYVAISEDGFHKLDEAPIFKRAIQKYALNFIVFNPLNATITEWKK